MITLNLAETLDLAEAVVADAPEDYVYEPVDGDCVYVHNGAPSCLVGHILVRAGVDLERMSEDQFPHHTPNARRLVDNLRCDGVISVTEQAREFLGRVQYLQDDADASWAVCVDIAQQPVEYCAL